MPVSRSWACSAALLVAGCHALLPLSSDDASSTSADVRTGDGPGDVTHPGDRVAADYGLPPTPVWSMRLGGAEGDQGLAVATDAGGNVYLTGIFEDTVDFGAGPRTSAGGRDAFVVSYSAAGAYRWSKTFGGPQNDYGGAAAVDTGGNLYVSGGFAGTVDLGGGAAVAQGRDVFVVSYTSSGAYRWARTFGGSADDYGDSVALDGNDNVYVTGSFSGTMNVEGAVLTSAGDRDIFIASWTAAGTPRWAKHFGGPASDSGDSLAAAGGELYLAAQSPGPIDFGGGALSGLGGTDIFVACFNDAGAHLWSRRFGGPGSDIVVSIAADGSGNYYLSGNTDGTLDMGGGPLTSAGERDILIAGLTGAGEHLWSRAFGGAASDYGRGVGVSGTVYMIGRFDGAVDVGGGPLPSAGATDIVVAGYTATGAHLWSRSMGGAGSDIPNAMAVGPGGALFVTGAFGGVTDLGGGALSSAGLFDVFLVKLAP